MKYYRMAAFLLCLVFLWGCTPKNGGEAIQFYYLRNEIEYDSPTGVLAPENQTELDPSGDLLPIIQQYLLGPKDESLLSPFPEGIVILKADHQGDTITLEFNESLSKLSGMDLTLACACMTKTCLDLTGAKTVSIRAKGTTLDGMAQITMTADSLLLLDSSGK